MPQSQHFFLMLLGRLAGDNLVVGADDIDSPENPKQFGILLTSDDRHASSAMFLEMSKDQPKRIGAVDLGQVQCLSNITHLFAIQPFLKLQLVNGADVDDSSESFLLINHWKGLIVGSGKLLHQLFKRHVHCNHFRVPVHGFPGSDSLHQVDIMLILLQYDTSSFQLQGVD